MGSELVRTAVAPPDGVRAARVGVGCDGGRRDPTLGAIVSPATPSNSFESMVAASANSFESIVAAFRSAADLRAGSVAFACNDSPQLGQNLLFAET